MNRHTPVLFLAACLLLASCAVDAGDEPASVTPTPGSMGAAVMEALTVPAETAAPRDLDQQEPAETMTSSTPSPASPPPTQAFIDHTVQPGDTLLGLAKKYGVPMAAIQLQNGLGDSIIVKVDETLSIPPQVGWEGASSFWVIHVVQEGETLIEIARAYDVEPDSIQAVNGLVDADLIGVDQELVLPLEGPAMTRTPFPTRTPKPAPTSTPAPTSAYTQTPEFELTPTPTAVPAPAPAADPPPADIAAWPRETVRLINEVRSAHGLPPLIYNETLAQAAQAHANDCSQRGWGSHTGSDGSDIKTRIIRAGYDPASWAECWALRKTPQGAVDIWMDEIPPNDPHRRTLLTTWLSEIGMGVAEADWGYYFIADFGRP